MAMTLALSAGLAVVAFLYSVVGHAGASGYIALMTLSGLYPETIKPVVLVLNIVVASIGCWNFLRAGQLPWRIIWPVYLLATPASFLGGYLSLPVIWFQRLIGIVLILSAWRLGAVSNDPVSLRQPSGSILLISGGILGLLAGLTGTGGGVFLTPLLLLTRWCNTRQAAATSILFILINSVSGLAGLIVAQPMALTASLNASLLGWIAAVLIGGSLGSRLGSRHWPVAWIRRSLALVLVLAALKLLGFQR
jgi:uncharacterized membrane protein YfcA